MTTPNPQPDQPSAEAPTQHDTELIAVNAALLRLFKGQYRDAGDRHNDSLFVRDHLILWHQMAGEHTAAAVAKARQTSVTGINPGHDALTAILSEVVVIDEAHKLDLLVGGYERIAAHFTPPAATGETPRTDALKGVPMTRNDSDDFSRMLERENAALREELRIIRQSVPDEHEVKGSAAGTVQNYIATLESERDDWKAKFTTLSKELMCELRDPNGTIWEHAKELQEKLTAAEEALENEKARGIHTCHDDCQRPLCVANRKLTAAEAEKHRLLAQIVTMMDEKEAAEARVKELEAERDTFEFLRKHGETSLNMDSSKMKDDLLRKVFEVVREHSRGSGFPIINPFVLSKDISDTIRARLSASESARRGLVEALEAVKTTLTQIRNSAGSQVMVCTAEGHSECVHRANAMLPAVRSALAASAKLDGKEGEPKGNP